MWAYTGEAVRLRRNCCASVGGFLRAGGDGGCVARLSVVWCARSGCERCAYFRWGDVRQHVEVWSSSWTDASCYETACLIQRRACDAWNGPSQDSNTLPRRDIVLSPSSSRCGGGGGGGGTHLSLSHAASS